MNKIKMKTLTTKHISAGEFKAKCLHLMDQVKEQKTPIIITKRGIPIAQLTPIEIEIKPNLFGYLKNSITIKADITAPIDEKWEADE